MKNKISFLVILQILLLVFQTQAQIGTIFPSERKMVKDPETGIDLVFLTSEPAGDSKIYETHNQWTSDGEWLIFRSNRVPGEAMAVNEKTGMIMQVTEGGYSGMLNVARESMKLYFMRRPENVRDGSMDIVEDDLARFFSDSKSGNLKNMLIQNI